MDSNAPVVAIQGLTKRYGSLVALNNVGVDIPRGKVGLLGPNGAGKTTLLKVLLGLLRIDRGRVEVMGRRVERKDREVRSLVGYMPEQDVYLPGMTAVQMCAYAAELCGLPKKEALGRAHEALHFVGLEDKRYQVTDGYSTGQKQRAKLACALVHDPELLLLDEPTNGLDPAGRDDMLELITTLPDQRGCALVLSTHLLPDVERVCDHAVLLDQGKVLRSSPLAELKAGSGGLLEVRPKGGQEEALKDALAQAGCNVELARSLLVVRLPEGAGTDVVLRAALEADLQVRHMAPHARTLLAAFMEALGHDEDGRPLDKGDEQESRASEGGQT
jgi:ABC-2 type transport system ATP-binding protein